MDCQIPADFGAQLSEALDVALLPYLGLGFLGGVVLTCLVLLVLSLREREKVWTGERQF